MPPWDYRLYRPWVRWGGLRAWRGAFPFFAGLIVGEAMMMAVWSGLNAAIGTKCYTCTE
jgi:hypothetical protein